MIDLQMKTIHLGEKTESIKAFQVWFRTPFGLHQELHQAIQTCEKNEWDVNTIIAPVAVAVGSTLYEEISRG